MRIKSERPVFLISYSGYPVSPTNFLPDNGLANLAGALIEEGFRVKIFDFNTPKLIKRLFPYHLSRKISPLINRILETKKASFKDIWNLLRWEKILRSHWNKETEKIGKELCGKIEEENPLFVGFKLWNGDGFSGSVTFARLIKKFFPQIPIVGGGPHVDIFKETIFKFFPVFDVLVYGEGEKSIVRLAEFFNGKGRLIDIPNLIFQENAQTITTCEERIENLDDLPFPVYDPEVYPVMEGDEEKIKMFVIDDSRGCNNRCHFCIHPVKSGKLRFKSPERIVEEIQRLKSRFHTRIFRYAGSSTPTKILRKTAELILEKGLDIEYTTFGHVRGGEKEDFEILKKSGCYAIFFGIESGNQRILDETMNKNVTVQRIRETIKMAKEAGIFVAGSLIYPTPLDNEQTREETLQLLKETKPDSAPVQFPLITPGTEWGENPEKFGFKLKCSYDKFLKMALEYKLKILFPPEFWVPFPYLVGNKPYKKYMKELSEFEKDIEKLGILTTVSDEMALLAKYLGEDPIFLRNEYRKLALCGKKEEIQSLVKKINKNGKEKYEE